MKASVGIGLLLMMLLVSATAMPRAFANMAPPMWTESMYLDSRNPTSWRELLKKIDADNAVHGKKMTQAVKERKALSIFLAKYLFDLDNSVTTAWRTAPPAKAPTRVSKVILTLEHNGQIASVTPVGQAAPLVAATKRAAPFRPVPPGGPDTIRIEIGFEPVEQMAYSKVVGFSEKIGNRSVSPEDKNH